MKQKTIVFLIALSFICLVNYMDFNIFVFSPMYHNQWHETLMYHKAIYKEGLEEEAGQLRDLSDHLFSLSLPGPFCGSHGFFNSSV